MTKLHPPGLRSKPQHLWHLDLDIGSTLRELHLYDFHVDGSTLGRSVATQFERDSLLPGVVLLDHQHFVGMLSRQRFLMQMSQPYSLELFLERPLMQLYNLLQTDVLVLADDTPIVEAAQRSLQRPHELWSEPLVVKSDRGDYFLLDSHQLLVAQSKIHQLTAQLLDEKTQAYLIQTEKMASLGRMVAGISHEIKNPVNCIHGNLHFVSTYSQDLIALITLYKQTFEHYPEAIQIFENDIDLNFLLSDFPTLLKSMELAGDRLVEIVSSLRNFSRIDSRTKQLINIHDCIDGTLLILNNRLKQGITVVRDYGEVPPIACYAGQLSQVFMNIISNSIEALTEKLDAIDPALDAWRPQISIKTDLLDIGSANAISIKLADNANGIPTEIQSKIFEPFFTTKPLGEGTGLGLAISHQIITQNHQGAIKVQSESNTGTEFEIQLPIL